MAAWGVGAEDARALLGAPPERTYYAWRQARAYGSRPTRCVASATSPASIRRCRSSIPIPSRRRMGETSQRGFRRPDAAAAHVRRRYGRPRGRARLPRRRPRALELTVPPGASIGRRPGGSWLRVIRRSPLFERLTPDPSVWEALDGAWSSSPTPACATRSARSRLSPREERVSGPGASYVMAAFTHLNPNGSRFSDGTLWRLLRRHCARDRDRRDGLSFRALCA